MNLFEVEKKINDEKLHYKFKMLKDSLIEEKEIIQEWSKGFIDKDNKFAYEFQTTFHSSFWELYLHTVFKEAKFTLDYSKQVPDFIVKLPFEFYVEAVVANIKEKGLKEEERTFMDTFIGLEALHLNPNFNQIIDESIVRYSNAIRSKTMKYKNEYSTKDWINKEASFTLALASYDQINYGVEFIYPLMALLYGLYFDVESQSYGQKDHILKPGTDAKIKLNIFSDKEFEDISAIIFTCTLTIGKLTSLVISKGKYSLNKVFCIRHDISDDVFPYKLNKVSPATPEHLSDGLIVFHNPRAKSPLPIGLFKETNALQIHAKGSSDLQLISENLPLVARVNSVFLRLFNDEMIMDLMIKYNGLDDKMLLDLMMKDLGFKFSEK
ncbi:hypothetical protein [Lysinibacillus odysseyi]|uniref:Uncharacterized protein n=1 Tax=Lysinibacillus odysseyi 34hs-1 = NBRC 100172 TaxID=1220589 RepID=A0A0A3IDE9_9BACI|nr:hypothetical protein [Lysinibacillus odysseyi]KGR82754.1 hypothetical protein CD32_18070 [Lysinibacillus odysseyi 34hs-1 = NBRC 100172]